MAIEALKSAGITAYQGSSPTPAVRVVEAPAQPEIPVASEVRVPEKSAETAGTKPDILGERLSLRDDPLNSVSKDLAEGIAPNESLKRAVEEINKKAQDSEAVFGVHDSTNRVTIKIVDKKTKEVLKEYPPEKTLDMIAKVWELAGLLVDEKR